MAFIKGQAVSFQRGVGLTEATSVVAAVATDAGKGIYVIESPNHGWKPIGNRITKYELDVNKKYLFAFESELTVL